MNDTDTAIVVKPLDASRVVVASADADGFDVDFAPIFDRLYGTVFGELGRLGITPAGPSGAFYEPREDGRVDVFAAVPVAPDAEVDSEVVEVRVLPAAERAATLIHHGNMANCERSYLLLQQWMAAAGETPQGFSREIYLDCPLDDLDAWVTELQFVLHRLALPTSPTPKSSG